MVETVRNGAHNHFSRLKYVNIPTATRSATPITAGYPHGELSSGISLKFMPYHPHKKVNGMNRVAMIVSTFIISLSRLLTLER